MKSVAASAVAMYVEIALSAGFPMLYAGSMTRRCGAAPACVHAFCRGGLYFRQRGSTAAAGLAR